VLTTVSTDNVDFARKLGADVVIDYKNSGLKTRLQNLIWCSI
jgi:NADPH:quinone reductase-like Zn-dependent oxidoreductase